MSTLAPTKENIAALRNAIEAQRESGARITESFFMSQLAEALLRVGDVPGAEAALQETFAFVEQSGETFWLADSYRVQGRIALCKHEPDRAQAEACFLQAVDVARGQQARLLELRAATSMARLWFDQGKRDEARDLLAPVYNWFTEGFDTLDLKEAKALLKELA
jgi:predicted ATPase